MLHLFASFLALMVMTMLGIEGANWITIGYGINPWLAFPVAVVFGFIGYWQVLVAVDMLEADALLDKHKAMLQRINKL